MHILIVSITSYKNVMLSMPLVQALKNKFPECVLHYVSSTKNQAYLQKIPLISETYFISGDAIPTVFSLLKINFSYVINLEQTFSGSIIINSLRNKYNHNTEFFQYPNNLISKIFNSKKAYQHKALSQKFMDACHTLQLPKVSKTLNYYTNEADNLKKDDIPTSHAAGYVCINLNELNLSANLLEAFCLELKFPIILAGNDANFEYAQKLKTIDPIKIYNACGKYTEAEMYNIFSRSKVNISAVCNYLYVMAATQKPLLVIDNTLPSLYDIEPYTALSGNLFKQNINTLNTQDVQKWISI